MINFIYIYTLTISVRYGVERSKKIISKNIAEKADFEKLDVRKKISIIIDFEEKNLEYFET